MILTRLTITNFGVYRGRHEFDLRPISKDKLSKPIILFVGKNGAGKTTILEAIRLCLYGRCVLGNRVRQVDYDAYIRQRMHRSAAHQFATSTASVGLAFDHVHAGVRSTYDAVRSWRAEARDVQESITIYKNGKPLYEIAPENWDDFLRDLIPPGVAALFFFDGEQVQALADSERESETLAAAIRRLLNLDLIDQLRSDLSIYLRQQDQRDRSRLRVVLDEAEKAVSEAQQRIQELQQDRAHLLNRQEWMQKDSERRRQQLVGQGATLIRRRDDLERQQRENELQIEHVSAALRELTAGLLPFAVCPQWCQRLRLQLLEEAAAERERLAYVAKQDQAAAVMARLLDPNFQQEHAPELHPASWARLVTAIQGFLTPVDQPVEITIRHGLSSRDRETLLAWIEMALRDVPQQVQFLGRQLEALEKERSRLGLALKQVPESTEVSKALEEFQQLSEEQGRVDEHIKQVDAELHQTRLLLAQHERERRQALECLNAAADMDERIHRAIKTQIVLEKYRERVTELKIQELEQAIAQHFNLLCRKQVLVREVRIDRKRFTVELFGPNRTLLPTSDLSAGEKQLYAMALLWALRAISGRGLPIIVDTPMGRLDRTHRDALLRHFFPHAAHQVIVLSTDTEITPEAYDRLQSVVSHTFHLEYDEVEGCTQVQRRFAPTTLEDVPV